MLGREQDYGRLNCMLGREQDYGRLNYMLGREQSSKTQASNIVQ